MIHKFETRSQDYLDFAASDRLSHHEVLEQRAALCSSAFHATVEAVPVPLLFFNPTRQLVHANPAAMKIVDETELDNVLGLRMGELLGCDHEMENLDCKKLGDCQNCNSMAAIVSALAGHPARQEMRLVIHPRSTRRRQVFDVSSIPVPSGDLTFAMVVMEQHLAM